MKPNQNMKSDTPETDKLLADATGYPHPMDAVDLAYKLERERDKLQRWKDEAMLVLYNWDRVWVAAGKPGQLGDSKAASVRALLENRSEGSEETNN